MWSVTSRHVQQKKNIRPFRLIEQRLVCRISCQAICVLTLLRTALRRRHSLLHHSQGECWKSASCEARPIKPEFNAAKLLRPCRLRRPERIAHKSKLLPSASVAKGARPAANKRFKSNIHACVRSQRERQRAARFTAEAGGDFSPSPFGTLIGGKNRRRNRASEMTRQKRGDHPFPPQIVNGRQKRGRAFRH